MGRKKLLIIVSVVFFICGSVYLLPHFLFPRLLIRAIPGDVVRSVSVSHLNIFPPNVTGHALTFYLTNGKKVQCNRMVADSAMLFGSGSFSLECEGIDFSAFCANFVPVVLDTVIVQGYRNAESFRIDSMSAEGTFGSITGSGSLVNEGVSARFVFKLLPSFVRQLPFVSAEMVDDAVDAYTVTVELEGTVSSPQVSVQSDLFTFDVRSNA